MPKQTALDTINRLIVEDRENGVTRRRTGGAVSTIDWLLKEEDERQRQREEEERQRRQARLNALSADSAMDLVRGLGNISAERKAAETPRAVRKNTGGNILTPEIEAEYQRRNGGGNSLSPYQVYMQNLVAQMPKVTAPEETRSNRDLRLDANRQALLAGGTNNMAADWATGKQNATTPAAQMLGLSDQGVRERMYDPTYTTRLRAIEQQNEAQQAKAVQARNQYVTIRAQRQAEEAWSKYAPYRSNPDFIEKSKPDLTNENRVYYSMAHSDEAIEENGANVNAAAYATDDEKQMYYYLWHTQGKDAADAYYYNYVETAASARKALDVELRTAARVENNNFFQDVKDSFKSIGTNAISGIGIVDLAFQNIGAEVSNLLGLGDPEINYYSLAQMPGIVTDSIRSNVAKKIAASTPGMTIGKAENAVNIASFLYETGMSMADSTAMVLMNLAGVPEWLTLGSMGASAGTRAVRDAKERGATDWQALAFGISSSIMEALFEKASLDSILKPSDGQFFKNAAKQTFVEGSEEFFTTWGNTVMDQIVMGDKSELFDRQRQLMEQGYSQKDALKEAALEWCIQIGTDALGGLISGFGMGGTKELGTGLGVFAMDLAQNLEGGLAVTDLQNMAAAAQQEAQLRQQYEQQQNAPQPQPLTIPFQEVVSSRQTDPLGYAMDKAWQGETVNKSDARAIIENPQALQALRDTGALTGKVSNDSEGRQKIIDAVNSLAEQRTQESSMPAAETQQTAATEAERAANPYDDLLSQIWGEQTQERTAPATATETRTETNDPAWDRIVADLEAQRARAAEQRAQERTAASTTTQETAQREDEVDTPPVPRAQETASEAPTEGKLRLPEQKDTPPVPRSGLTLRSENATLNENRQEVTNGQAETAAPAETADERRAREESAAFRRAANDAAGGADLDRAEWRAGLGRLLQAVRNSRDAGARQQRRSEAARITDQAEAGNPERLSARDLGVADGTDEKTAVRVDDKILGSQWQQTVADYARRGIKLTAISGQLRLNKRNANGSHVQARAYISADGKSIVVQADNPRLSWHQLLAHEELHRLIKEDSGYRKRVMDALLADKKVRPYLSQVIDRYAEAYHSVDPTATDEDIIEELLADYRAGFDMLDPLGTNRTLAKVTKAAAKDIRAVEKDRQFDPITDEPRTAAERVEKYSYNPQTVDYAIKYTVKDEKTKSQLNLMKNTTTELADIQGAITKALGKKASRNIHDFNDYLQEHQDVWQRLWDMQQELIDSGIRCDFVTEPGTPNVIDGEEVPGGLKGLPIEYVASDTGKRYKFTAFWRGMPQMFMDSMTHDSRERLRTEIVKGVEDAYARRIGETDLLPYLKDQFPTPKAKEITKVAGERKLKNIRNQTQKRVQPPIRDAEKTVGALNLNSACPMFTVGNNGCYLDACYLTQMANGATGTNLFRSAWYAGEILQIAQSDIDLMNELGGLRVNGVGDTTLDNKSQLKDAIRHAGMRGLKMKMITKQRATLEVLAELHNSGVDISHVTVQPSMDNLWIPAELDDAYGAGVRGNTQLADTVKAGRLEAAASGYDEMFGRATKIVDGVLYRKYGFSPQQIQEMKEDFPFVTITPRYVVCTAAEIAEIALNRNGEYVNGGKLIQTLMHGKVPSGCISDYPGELINFGGARHVVERKDGKWHFYGEYIGKGGAVGKIIDGPKTPYGKVQAYVEQNYTKAEQDKIWITLKNQMCCQANDFKDACAGCQSLCARGCAAFSAEDFDYRKYSEKEKMAAATATSEEAEEDAKDQGKASTEIDESDIIRNHNGPDYVGTKSYRVVSSGESPMSQYANYAMFADDPTRIVGGGYGDNLYTVDHKALTDIGELKPIIAEAWDKAVENGTLPVALEYLEDKRGNEIAEMFDPEDIVDSADAWDNPDLITWAAESEIFDGITGVKTFDGAVVLDDAIISSGDYNADVLGAKLDGKASIEIDPEVAAQFSPEVLADKEVRALIRENEDLKKKLKYWKAQTKTSDRTQPRTEDVRRMAKNLLSEFDSKADGENVTDALGELAHTIMGNDSRWSDIQDQARRLAGRIIESSDLLGQNETGELGYSSTVAEATQILANDIIDAIMDDAIRRAPTTFADRAESRLDKEAQKGDRRVQATKERLEAKADARVAREREKGDLKAQRVQERADERLAREQEKWEQRTQRLQERADNRLAREMEKSERRVQKVKDLLAAEKERRREKIAELKEHYKAKEAKGREDRAAQKMRAKIEKHAKQMLAALEHPTDKKHIPDSLRKSVAAVLSAIDLGSGYDTTAGQDGKTLRVGRGTEGAEQTKRTKAFLAVRDALMSESNGLVLDPELLGTVEEPGNLIRLVTELADIPIANMNTEQLQVVYDALRGIESAVKSANRMLSQARWAAVSEAADAIRGENGGKQAPLQLAGAAGRMQDLTRLDMLTPEGYFHRLGKSGQAVFKMLRGAQDQFITNMAKATTDTQKIVGDTDVRALEKEKHTVTMGGEQVTMTTAQIMELYCLMQRDQGLQHITTGGILIEPIRQGVKKTTQVEPVHPSMEELLDTVRLLTPDEIRMADALQDYLSKDMAELGNEATIAVYGYKKFGQEEKYWKIRSNKNETPQSIEKETQTTSVANRGFTKAINPNADTSIKIGSIFDTYSQSINDMATYAAWLAVGEDVNRIRNFIFRDADGQRTGTVKGILDRVIGSGGAEYLQRLMADIANGAGMDDAGLTSGFVGAYKAAAIGANIRVIIQQPTAILRAAEMIDPKYLAEGLKNPMQAFERAKEHSPIAQWKDWGYFDINTGRKMKDVLFENSSRLEQVRQASMALAGKADSFAWGQLWGAVEAETKAKGLKPGTKEFYDACAERFNAIIDHTQVVDGILQRSQIMRSKNAITRMAVSFMSEPTKQYNQFMSAVYDYRHSGDKKQAKQALARTTFSMLAAGIMNVLAQSIVDALRNGDREKKYWEKLLQAFLGYDPDDDTFGEKFKTFAFSNMGEFINPASYLPYAKDIMSIIQGYSVERMDMDGLSDTITAITRLAKAINGEGKQTVGYTLGKAIEQGAKLLGLSAYNVDRDLTALITTIANDADMPVLQYYLNRYRYRPGDNLSKELKGILWDARQKNDGSYDIIVEHLLKDGYTQEQIGKVVVQKVSDESGFTEARKAADAEGNNNGSYDLQETLEALGNATLTEEDRDVLLEAKLNDKQYGNYTTLLGYADYDTWLSVMREMPSSLSQAKIEAVLDKRDDLTTNQKAAFWQVLSGATSTKNNPYSQEVGEEILNAKAENQPDKEPEKVAQMRSTLTGLGLQDSKVDALAPVLGGDGSNTSKWRAVADQNLGKEQQDAVLASIMTDAMYRNWTIASGENISLDSYVKGREAYVDLDNSGTDQNSEWTAALEKVDFDKDASRNNYIKGVLWQIYTGSTSTKNNPFDKAGGQAVLDAKSGGGSGSGSYARAQIPTLRLPAIPKVEKPSSGLRIRGTQTTSAAPRSGLRIRAK